MYDGCVRSLRHLPLRPGATVSLYVCGITPYDATHLGHAATYLAFDLLGRLWRDAGQQVQYVQNVTDIDDPLLERATRDGVDWRALAETQTQLFREDMTALNAIPPQHYIGAIESIEWIVPAVERMLAQGTAYRLRDAESGAIDIYFDVRAAETAPGRGQDRSEGWRLGAVSGLSEEQMLPLFAERGGDPGRPGKRNPLDALLWRGTRPGEPSWPGGMLGDGRPGWHIECAVIARRFLPAPFTVQGGGSDLAFPHHEMGAGHVWALDGAPLAEYYLHAGMVGLDGEKMSKSRGNLVLVSRLREQGANPAAIRLAILAHHYRSDWFWEDRMLVQAQQRLEHWRQALRRAPEGSAAPLLAEIRAALGADLDAPRALAAVDQWAVKAVNSTVTKPWPSIADVRLVSDALESLLGIVL